MNLILSDKRLDFSFENKTVDLIELSSLNISNCIGCFGCWTKTPGKCVIRDDAVHIYPKIAKSKNLLLVSRIKYGGFDTIMKTMLERSIPIQQPFIRLLNGETHHIQRNVCFKKAVIIGYGSVLEEEKDIFLKLIERNANNLCFKEYKVIFVNNNEIEQTIKKEVSLWEK